MNSKPIERRLNEYAGAEAELSRAAALLRQLPTPEALPDGAQRRTLSVVRALSVGGQRPRWLMQPTLILAMLVFSVAASATRGWWKPASSENRPAPSASVVPQSAEAPAKVASVRKLEPAVQEVLVETPAPPAVKVQRPVQKRGAAGAQPVLARPRLLSDPQQGVNRPIVPPNLAREERSFTSLLDVCVDTTGAVTSVNVLHPADPILDQRIALNVQSWKYAPATANGRAVPMCFQLLYRLRMDEHGAPAP